MKINTHHGFPPVFSRLPFWTATYDDYDGAEDSSNRGHIGYGTTEAEAIADLTANHPREQ